MFSMELKITIDALLKWFYNLNKSRFVEIDTLTKQKYGKNHPIDWSQRNQCVTVRQSLSVRPFVHLLHFFYILLNDLGFLYFT